MINNIEKTKEYFDKSYRKLRPIKKTKQLEIVKATASSLEGKLQGAVLDIGSGGRIDYSLENINKLVSFDISSESLESSKKSEKVQIVHGDARRLNMQSNIFDRVIILHTIHHLAGNNLFKTYSNVKDCVTESYRVLKDKGKILVIDAVCSNLAQKVENLSFGVLYLILQLFNKPMVYYSSLSGIVDVMVKVGFKDINFSYLNTKNAILCPFTSKIGIPFKYTPLSHVLIEGIK